MGAAAMLREIEAQREEELYAGMSARERRLAQNAHILNSSAHFNPTNRDRKGKKGKKNSNNLNKRSRWQSSQGYDSEDSVERAKRAKRAAKYSNGKRSPSNTKQSDSNLSLYQPKAAAQTLKESGVFGEALFAS